MKRFLSAAFLLCSFAFVDAAEQNPDAIPAYLTSTIPNGSLVNTDKIRTLLQDIFDTSRGLADEYKGDYNATTNTPSLTNGTGNKGDWYTVSVAGTRNFGAGSIALAVGDEVWYTGTIFKKRSTSATSANYRGVYDASANTPAISDATGTAGDIWIVQNVPTTDSLSGAKRNLGSGDLLLFYGDLLIHDGSVFQVVPTGRNRVSVISLDWFPFTRGLGITTAQAMANSDLLEQVKQIAANVTQHETNVGVIQLTGSGPYEFSDTIDNCIYGSGSPETTANYGTLTYSATNNTLVRTVGDWSPYATNRFIKIRDANNPGANGIWMIASLSGSTMTLRRDSDGPGSDDVLGVTGTSTTATLTPINLVANRVSLSLMGSTVGGWVIKKHGAGTAIKRHSHFSNNWTTSRIPGGVSTPLTDTYYSYDLRLDGLEVIATNGHAIWVESGDSSSAWSIGSVRAKNLGTTKAAVYLDETFSGVITDLYINWTNGDGIQCNVCTTCYIKARIEGAGGDGVVGSATGNVFHVNSERCAKYGINITGNGNSIFTYLEGNNSGIANSPTNPNPLDGGSIPIQSTSGAVPEIRVAGIGNLINCRVHTWSGDAVNDPQFLNPIDFGDIASTYTTKHNYGLPTGFDVRSKAKPWANSPWPDKIAYLSLERIAKWQREHGIPTSVAAFNYPDGGNTAVLDGDKIKIIHAVGAHSIASGDTRTVKWLDQMLDSNQANSGYDSPVTTITGVAGADVTFATYGGGYTPAYVTRNDAGGSWINDGWKVGQKCTITLSASNNVTATVRGVSKSSLYLSGTLIGGSDEDVTFTGTTDETGTNLATFTVDPGDVVFYKVRYSTNQWNWFQTRNKQISGAATSTTGGQIPLLVLGWAAGGLAQEIYSNGPGIQEYTGYREVVLGAPGVLALNNFHLVTCTEVNDSIHGAGAGAASPAAETWIHSLELSVSDNAWNDN